MSSMFEKCENLIILETEYLNMDNVLFTKNMFADCHNLNYKILIKLQMILLICFKIVIH